MLFPKWILVPINIDCLFLNLSLKPNSAAQLKLAYSLLWWVFVRRVWHTSDLNLCFTHRIWKVIAARICNPIILFVQSGWILWDLISTQNRIRPCLNCWQEGGGVLCGSQIPFGVSDYFWSLERLFHCPFLSFWQCAEVSICGHSVDRWNRCVHL